MSASCVSFESDYLFYLFVPKENVNPGAFKINQRFYIISRPIEVETSGDKKNIPSPCIASKICKTR